MKARTLALVLVAAPLAAQQPAAQPDFHWEKALAAGSTVSIHNLSGDVKVTPSTSGKVEVTGVRHGRDRDEVTVEVVETSRGIIVCAMYKGADMQCDDDGYRVRSERRRGWRDDDWDASIDINVKIPKGMELEAHSVSGDVSATGAEGDVRAGSVSGDVRLEQLNASAVRATSVSGDVDVVIDALTGTGALEFTSVSGDVTVTLPKGTNADVTMRSVSGSLDSDFPLTLNGRMSRGRVEARIGQGGRDLEVHTVSGDVRIRMPK